MSNKGAPAVDAEMQQFQDDLLQSIQEFKDGNFACVTQIEPHNVDEYCKPRMREAKKSHVVPNNLTADISGKVKRGLP